MIDHLRLLLLRDLAGTRREIELYPNDAALWAELPGLPNTGGNLALHLAGNLRHFIGHKLGGSGYIRRRDEEFAARDLSREEVLSLLEATEKEVAATLDKLEPARLDDAYELPNGQMVTTGRFLLHLAMHLTFHLGQIDYHRRAVTGDKTAAGLLPLSALSLG